MVSGEMGGGNGVRGGNGGEMVPDTIFPDTIFPPRAGKLLEDFGRIKNREEKEGLIKRLHEKVAGKG